MNRRSEFIRYKPIFKHENPFTEMSLDVSLCSECPLQGAPEQGGAQQSIVKIQPENELVGEPGSEPGSDEPGSEPGSDEPGSEPGSDEPGSEPEGVPEGKHAGEPDRVSDLKRDEPNDVERVLEEKRSTFARLMSERPRDGHVQRKFPEPYNARLRQNQGQLVSFEVFADGLEGYARRLLALELLHEALIGGVRANIRELVDELAGDRAKPAMLVGGLLLDVCRRGDTRCLLRDARDSAVFIHQSDTRQLRHTVRSMFALGEGALELMYLGLSGAESPHVARFVDWLRGAYARVRPNDKQAIVDRLYACGLCADDCRPFLNLMRCGHVPETGFVDVTQLYRNDSVSVMIERRNVRVLREVVEAVALGRMRVPRPFDELQMLRSHARVFESRECFEYLDAILRAISERIELARSC